AFLHLAEATFSGMDREPVIRFIDMPEDIRDKYQYYTEANMHKLKEAGYREKFYTLEEGVDDYVRNYLMAGMYF
ncbi:MAG TPA: ADP-L-glycero-D-mannoheptose-6-epimerase, partial [Flavihumibacter sp.]|nr:ADP-L-glycero-D-mannoheptose-6-epimerase [Flavihumibacter sp.]